MIIPKINSVYSALEGFPPPPPPDGQVLVDFFIGEDVFIKGFLVMESMPVSINDWEVTAIVKSSAFSPTVTWQGVLNNGIYMTAADPGIYEVLIPSEVFEGKAPGTFWLEIFLKEKIGRFHRVKDRKALGARIPFSMNQAAISDNVVDSRDIKDTSYPPSTNITKL